MITIPIGLFIYLVFVFLVLGALIGLIIEDLVQKSKKRRVLEEARRRDIEDYRKSVSLNLKRISYYLERLNNEEK